MTLSDFEIQVLEFVANDYEALHTIQGDLARDLQREVSGEELGAALVKLALSGLVRSFSYGAENGKFQQIAAPDGTSVAKCWFLISDPGKEALPD